jgi:ABC-2 type transport system permease protein
VTILAFYAVVFHITFPSGWLHWLLLASALLLGWLVSFCWRFLVNLAAFWTPNAMPIGRLGFSITWLLSGFLMPLRFFPEWFERACYLTPFPYTVNTIIEIYLGLLPVSAALRALGLQLAWAAGLLVLCLWVMQRGVRRLVILGG